MLFNAPYTLFSKNIAGSFRNASQNLGVKMLLLKEVNHLILKSLLQMLVWQVQNVFYLI
jgi:hypothetical protein